MLNKEEEQEYQNWIDGSGIQTQFNIWHGQKLPICQQGSSAEEEQAEKEISPLVIYSPFFICSSN